jgi:hypothetical protein
MMISSEILYAAGFWATGRQPPRLLISFPWWISWNKARVTLFYGWYFESISSFFIRKIKGPYPVTIFL